MIGSKQWKTLLRFLVKWLAPWLTQKATNGKPLALQDLRTGDVFQIVTDIVSDETYTYKRRNFDGIQCKSDDGSLMILPQDTDVAPVPSGLTHISCLTQVGSVDVGAYFTIIGNKDRKIYAAGPKDNPLRQVISWPPLVDANETMHISTFVRRVVDPNF